MEIGDRVYASSYVGELMIIEKDDSLSDLLGETHWLTMSVDYIEGKHKTYNGDSYKESELTLSENTPGFDIGTFEIELNNAYNQAFEKLIKDKYK